MAYGFLKSEVGHHASEALLEDVTTTFHRLLTLLTTFGCFQALEQLLEVAEIKIGGSVSAGVGKSVGHFL
jgi:hypothetical protein